MAPISESVDLPNLIPADTLLLKPSHGADLTHLVQNRTTSGLGLGTSVYVWRRDP